MKPWMKRTALAAALAAFVAGPVTALRAEQADEAAAADKAADKENEMKIWMEHVNDSIEALNKKSEESVKFNIEGFTDLRYDRQSWKAATINNNRAVRKTNVAASPDGAAGAYDKRSEIKMFGSINPSVKYSLGFDLVSLKLKDVGFEIVEIPLIPFGDVAPEWNFTMKVGQFRQHFGIEAQTSSSKILFAERSILNGGASPFADTAKLVGERGMGLFFAHKKKFDFLAYEIDFDYLAQEQQDQGDGSANKGGTVAGIKGQDTDQDFSPVARFALEPSLVSNLIPGGTKMKFGVSYYRDSQNTKYQNYDAANLCYYEALGLDASGDFAKKLLTLQAEWVGRNKTSKDATPGAAGSVSVTQRQESWYTAAVVRPLTLFGQDMPNVELMGRLENFVPVVGADPLINYTVRSAETFGVKWTYLGNCHTAVNYTVYGVDQDFGSMAETNLLTIQQQIAF